MAAPVQEASAVRSRPDTRLTKAHKAGRLRCTRTLNSEMLAPSHWDCLRSGIDAMKRVLMLALVRGAAPLLAPRHAVRSFARRPAPKKRPSVSMALCVAASRKRIEDPVASRYRRRRRTPESTALPEGETPSTPSTRLGASLRRAHLCRETPHADAIDARVDDTVSTQARPPRRPKKGTSNFTTSQREDHPAVTQSGRGSRRGG